MKFCLISPLGSQCRGAIGDQGELNLSCETVERISHTVARCGKWGKQPCQEDSPVANIRLGTKWVLQIIPP